MVAQNLVPPSVSSQAYVASDADRVRSRLMRDSLTALLDQVSGSRQVLTHLAALENLLAKRGVRGLDSVAPKVLERICTQLSSLPLPREDPPLVDLLGRLLDLIDTQELPQPYLSTFMSDSRLLVSEASQSEFEAAERGEAPRSRGA